MTATYVAPGWLTKNVFNRIVAGLTRVRISVWGSRVLAVRGRKSGDWRRTPFNLLTLGDRKYLVSPRGTTQWVRNIRVSREAELRLGFRAVPIRVVELADEEKPPVLRPPLRPTPRLRAGVTQGATDDVRY
ncbi:MAG: nitroreductase/quinone reductase family protein [Acidimicrobiales bacterium]